MNVLTQPDIEKIIDLKLKSTELIWDDPERGQVYKSVGPQNKNYWTIQIPEMICVSPAEEADPGTHYFLMFGIVEEVRHRLQNCLSLKIDPRRMKGLVLHRGNTFEHTEKAVQYLDEWRLNENYWQNDPELQRRNAERNVR